MPPDTIRQSNFGRPPPTTLPMSWCSFSAEKDILAEQGMPFTSKFLVDLCLLLLVKHLRMSVYQPQMDGLIKRFNQTLKRIRWVGDREERNWYLFLPFVLFSVRKTPQARTGFTPFKLLFGQWPQNLLDMSRQAWVEQPSLCHLVVEHV